MPTRYVSLREVARQLGIPPSTVVYYKDRFAEFIPCCGGAGRRRRYPAEAIGVFRNIRELFDNNWAAEQIAGQLASGRGIRQNHGSSDLVAGTQPGTAEGQAAAGQVADLHEIPLLLKREIDALREEIAELRREHQAVCARCEALAAPLAHELDEIKRAKAELERMLGAAQNKAASASPLPSEQHLSRPLVIRTDQGEYIGVLDKNRKPFALGDFVRLIEARAGGRMMDLNWEKTDSGWSLVVRLADGGEAQHLILVTQQTVTPSKNLVTEILRLNINGSDVPEALLPTMFKKIKDSFDRQGP